MIFHWLYLVTCSWTEVSWRNHESYYVDNNVVMLYLGTFHWVIRFSNKVYKSTSLMVMTNRKNWIIYNLVMIISIVIHLLCIIPFSDINFHSRASFRQFIIYLDTLYIMMQWLCEASQLTMPDLYNVSWFVYSWINNRRWKWHTVF